MARVAGVSVATVSRALRGLDRVSPQTREKVLRVAEDLHYVASPTATSLASGRTRVVAVVAPFLTRWFFATLVSAIEKSLRAQGHH
ncbi:LacI family DNA-binding transcriptional regulator, partial [Ornithinibacter sp.]